MLQSRKGAVNREWLRSGDVGNEVKHSLEDILGSAISYRFVTILRVFAIRRACSITPLALVLKQQISCLEPMLSRSANQAAAVKGGSEI